MLRRRIRAHYEQMSEFERGRFTSLKEAGWTNRAIARHLGRSDAAIDDVIKSGSTTAYISVRTTVVDLGPQQNGNTSVTGPDPPLSTI